MGCVSSKSKNDHNSKKYESNQTNTDKDQVPSQPIALQQQPMTTLAAPQKTQNLQKVPDQQVSQEQGIVAGKVESLVKENESKPQSQEKQTQNQQQNLVTDVKKQEDNKTSALGKATVDTNQMNNNSSAGSNIQLGSLAQGDLQKVQDPQVQGQLPKLDENPTKTAQTAFSGNSEVKNNNEHVAAAVDPTSLKGLTQTLAGQQMRISKGGRQPKQKEQSSQGNNNIFNSNNFDKEDFDLNQDYQEEPEANMGMYAITRQTMTKPQARDYIVNKHMNSILDSLKTNQTVGKTCYSTPPIPLLDSDIGGGEWVQIETFGVFGQNEEKQQDNFMYD